jgi:hypothetical protein
MPLLCNSATQRLIECVSETCQCPSVVGGVGLVSGQIQRSYADVIGARAYNISSISDETVQEQLAAKKRIP